MYYLGCLVVCLAVLLALSFWLIDTRTVMIYLISRRLAELGCSNLPVFLESASIDFWTFELRGLRIGNTPGEWNAPFAMHLDRLRITVGSILGMLSIHPGAPPFLFRLSRLEFTLGFRIKEVETVLFEGMVIYIEDAPTLGVEVLKRGTLLKKPIGLGSMARKDFVLDRTRLACYEVGSSKKPQSVIRMYASSTVEPLPEVEADAFPFELISGKDRLTLLAATEVERDEWVEAIKQAIAEVPQSSSKGIVENNAPWWAAFVAEDEGRKVLWRRRAAQRRRAWHDRWQQSGVKIAVSEARAREAEEAVANELAELSAADPLLAHERARANSGGGKAHNPLIDFVESLKKQGAWAARTAATSARLVEQKEAFAAESRFDDSVEFMVGRFVVDR